MLRVISEKMKTKGRDIEPSVFRKTLTKHYKFCLNTGFLRNTNGMS